MVTFMPSNLLGWARSQCFESVSIIWIDEGCDHKLLIWTHMCVHIHTYIFCTSVNMKPVIAVVGDRRAESSVAVTTAFLFPSSPL